MSLRILAVDWSGAAIGAEKKIWLAEATADGELIRLECGRRRDEIAAHLVDETECGKPMIVGLDFGFSLPAWYLDRCGWATAPQLWEQLADGQAETLLSACAAPFWGRAGRARPQGDEQYRRTERDVVAAFGVQPKSVFQIGGAGAVGTGSLRGMCSLHGLRPAGLRIWPFDAGTSAAAATTVIEIYPRLMTGPIRKRRIDERTEFVEKHLASQSTAMRALAASTEDAFDAAVSALVMADHASELAALPEILDPQLLREGMIWQPARRFDGQIAIGPAPTRRRPILTV